MSAPPPSLRVYMLLKALPGSVFAGGILDEDSQLLAEIDTYAAEEGRVASEQAQQHAPERGRRRPLRPRDG